MGRIINNICHVFGRDKKTRSVSQSAVTCLPYGNDKIQTEKNRSLKYTGSNQNNKLLNCWK